MSTGIFISLAAAFLQKAPRPKAGEPNFLSKETAFRTGIGQGFGNGFFSLSFD